MARVPRSRGRRPARHDRGAVRLLQAPGLVLSPLLEEWHSLDAGWREVLSLAWEACAAGTIPVGAVVVDESGDVVARGRNRVYERTAPRGELAWSLLAHAEVNALAGLSPERRYEKHVLLTALEPCLLCIGATRLATVGAIRYGAPDPYGGAAAIALADSNPMLERLGLDVSGPELDGIAEVFAALHAEFFLRRNATGHVAASIRASDPSLMRLAESLHTGAAFSLAASGRPLQQALPELEAVIEA